MAKTKAIFCVILSILCIESLSNAFLFEFPHNVNLGSTYKPTLTASDITDAIELADESYDKLERLETTLVTSPLCNRVFGWSGNFQSQPQIDRTADILIKAAENLMSRKCRGIDGVNVEECAATFKTFTLPPTRLRDACMNSSSLLRTSHAYRRLLPANYRDGLYQMQKGHGIPSPRTISKTLAAVIGGAGREQLGARNVAFVQWVQFVEQDLAQTITKTMGDGHPIKCCSTDHKSVAPRYLHPACAPLLYSEQTQSERRESCLSYVRSQLAVDNTCRLDAAQQLNKASSLLDLSQIYPHGSLMGASEILPQKTSTSQSPLIASLHNIFVRSHNKLIERYRIQHKHWTPEHLYSEARAANIAQYQMIVFEELAPLLLGDAIQQRLQNERLSVSMNEDSLRTSNEMATAAIRFHRWMTPEAIRRRAMVQKPTDSSVVSAEVFENTRLNESCANLMVGGNLESFLEGTFNQQLNGTVIEFNALALDVQRGRDHGLRPYVDYVKRCNVLGRVDDFQDLGDIMDVESIDFLRQLYNTVDQVDLIVGAGMERILPNAAVGPTFACILAEQLSQTQNADLMFYRRQPNSSITNAAARLLCATTLLNEVPTNIFLTPSNHSNPMLDCGALN